MDDLTPFDRLVAGEFLRDAGPSLPVDDATIFSAITATQSPKLRFRSMFSALKFVIAGAIVALFGGFLVVGLVTRPSEVTTPAASAPPATAMATAEPTATSGLLPGVDLDAEEVSPGVFRVLGDRVHDLSQGVHDVAVGTDGGIWVLTSGSGQVPGLTMGGGAWVIDGRVSDTSQSGPPPEYWWVERLGEPGRWMYLPETSMLTLGLSPDGAPVISDGDLQAVLKDGAWVVPMPEDPPCPGAGVLMPDGVCWRTEPVPSHLLDGQWQTVSPEDLGLPGDRLVDDLVVGPDGTGWASVRVVSSAGEGAAFDGLLSYDGETWTRIPFSPSSLPEDAVGQTDDLVVAPDGAVWIVEHYFPAEVSGSGWWARRWDGATWASYGPVDDPRWLKAVSIESVARTAHFDPDGTAWFEGGGLYFDGNSLHTVERCWGMSDPELCEGSVSAKSASIDPAGNAWVATRDRRLYAITPEGAVGAGQANMPVGDGR